MNGKWIFILIQPLVLRCLSSPDSCYYCGGTRQCGDPMDFNEVSPGHCEDNSVCVKYMTTSENKKREVVAHQLTYRRCFKPHIEIKDSCQFLKKYEKVSLRELNLSLTAFECYECNETNCNSANNIRLFASFLYFVVVVNILIL